MFELHVKMQVKPGAEQKLEKTYNETFRPAISKQEGFRSVTLLRPLDGAEDYVLTIRFDDRGRQQKWVATGLHQQVWTQMENFCAGYTVQNYDTV